jgi:hypothetical protein
MQEENKHYKAFYLAKKYTEDSITDSFTPLNNNPDRLPEANSLTIDDLKPFSKIKLRKKRNIRKFEKHWRNYVPEYIANEFLRKMLVKPLLRRFFPSNLMNQLITIEPMENTK